MSDAVNPNGIKTLSTYGLSAFFINHKPTLINGPRSLPRNLIDCIIFIIWVCNSFTLADTLFAKDLQRFTTCLLVSSLELTAIFDDSLEVVPVWFFAADFNLSTCESGNFTYTLLYWVIFILILY